MSLEPQTTGKLILKTSKGPIDVEIWCKECPNTSQLFIQRCMDGFYDDRIFNIEPALAVRIEPQTEETSKPETNSRLQFNRRGLLGCNGDGFFITLCPAPELQGKYTLLGRIANDTVYNLVDIGNSELENGKPIFETRINTVDVTVPYFDIQKKVAQVAEQNVVIDKKSNAVKIAYDEDEDEMSIQMKSMHDIAKEDNHTESVATEATTEKDIVAEIPSDREYETLQMLATFTTESLPNYAHKFQFT